VIKRLNVTELSEIISSSKDPAELKYYWIEWYNKAGLPTKEDFLKYVKLSQTSADLNG
jgi:peptidyl-dipeptidase A